MKITKLGHCALVLEISTVRVLTDPGSYTVEAQEALTGIHILLITHEHADHLHTESVKKILAANPDCVVITNSGAGAVLEHEGIPYTKVGDRERTQVQGVRIEGYGRDHAPIYGDMGRVENTGYLINESFYIPGDNLYNPGTQVEILALPVAGPWMKIAEAVDFAREMKAPKAFGIHDGMIVPSFRSFAGMLMKNFVPDTEYTVIPDGETVEF